MAIVTIAGLKGGIGKTITAWNTINYFQRELNNMGFKKMNVLDLDYKQDNMRYFNSKKEDNLFEVTSIEDGKKFVDFIEDEKNEVYIPTTLTFVDTGRYDNLSNFYALLVSDVTIALMNPSKEIELRVAITTLQGIDEILKNEGVERKIDIHILYTRVHTSFKSNSFDDITEFLKSLEFDCINLSFVDGYVYLHNRQDSLAQHGFSFWDTDVKEGGDKVYDGMIQVMKYIKKKIIESTGE